jgi:hypothetical protein
MASPRTDDQGQCLSIGLQAVIAVRDVARQVIEHAGVDTVLEHEPAGRRETLATVNNANRRWRRGFARRAAHRLEDRMSGRS